jgi:hypothetical protein
MTVILVTPVHGTWEGHTDPMKTPSLPKTLATAPASMGSPTKVPVPWSSTNAVRDTSKPAAEYAWRINASWASPFGFEKDELLPSEFEAVDLITARMWSPAATAALNFFRYKALTPSALAYPFALASKVLHEASGESAPTSASPTVKVGEIIKLAAATTAEEQSPCCRA